MFGIWRHAVRIEQKLNRLFALTEKLMTTAQDVLAAQTAANASIDKLIDIASGQSAHLADVSAQLAAATAQVGAQGASTETLDAILSAMAAEKVKVDAALASLSPAPATAVAPTPAPAPAPTAVDPTPAPAAPAPAAA